MRRPSGRGGETAKPPAPAPRVERDRPQPQPQPQPGHGHGAAAGTPSAAGRSPKAADRPRAAGTPSAAGRSPTAADRPSAADGRQRAGRRAPREWAGRLGPARVGAALGLAVVAALGVGAGVRQLAREPTLTAPDIGALPSAPTIPTAGTSASPQPRARHTTAGAPAAGALAAVPPAVPVEVALPGVTATVVPIGVRASGQLDLPDSPRTVGWWVGSAPAGSPKPTVLAGHVDSKSAGAGALAALRDVTAGSPIVLTDAFGDRHAYQVSARRTYPKNALPRSVFTGAPLVLVTCGGPFDARTGSYRDNIVVYAVAS